MPHVALDVYDHNRNKVCNLYDSSLKADGQAHNIVYSNNLNGFKELSFNLPYVIDKRRNFRWGFVRGDCYLRMVIDDFSDWFIIQTPTKKRDGKAQSTAVSCSHQSTILRTKNLYMTFDDTNGIGTLPYLIEQILRGTGWTLGECDTFLERDGRTEKVRSLISDGKSGAYQLITDVCNLFGAYPVYDGNDKTVNIYAFNNKKPMIEISIGKDIESVTVSHDTSNLITRLYVEGEYGDSGYIGIDDVNPTGLSYLMNFDYYKSIGMFTEEHQAVLDQYYIDMAEAIAVIRNAASLVSAKENELNELWGQCKYVLYLLSNGEITRRIVGGNVPTADLNISKDDSVIILQNDETYRKATAGENGALELTANDEYILKYVTPASGLIGSREVSIEAKEKRIKSLQDSIRPNTSDEKRAQINEQIAALQSEIQVIYVGLDEGTGLYDMTRNAVLKVIELGDLNHQREEAILQQNEVEVDFAIAMGDMLKEGYWHNSNYAVGQEALLYEDALDMMVQMSKPAVVYNVSLISLAHRYGLNAQQVDINAKARIYDPELQINDIVFVSSVTRCLDAPQDDTVQLSNEDITLQGLTLDSILSRMTKLADLIDQKNSLFDRSKTINRDGSIYLDRLEGEINVLKNKLSSTVSSWYTDDNGNLVFESTTGTSAMMLTGDGFMIAAGRLADGTWNWRTFGTGEGFTADAIITGFLSADRIEARTITVEKLSNDVGATIDLSENNSVKIMVGDEVNYELDPVRDILARQGSEIVVLEDEISSRVTLEELNNSLSSKADATWVSQQFESNAEQTAKDITFSFEQSKKFTEDSLTPLQEFEETVRSYQRFTVNGQELGMEGSPFVVKLSNDRLSFLEDGVEVAYVSNNSLYITEARVTDRLAIGTEDNGYFDWITTPTGLGLKWRD